MVLENNKMQANKTITSLLYPNSQELFVVTQGAVLMYAESHTGETSQFMGRFNPGSLVSCSLYERWPEEGIFLELHSNNLLDEVIKRADTNLDSNFIQASALREARMYAAAARLSAICKEDLYEGILYAVAILNGDESARKLNQVLFGGADIAKVVGTARETISREFRMILASEKVTKIGQKYFITERGKGDLNGELLRTIVH